MSNTRQHVHELIDRLPPTQLPVVAGLLEAMLDSVSHAIVDAPVEDEEISEEEEQAVARSKDWFQRNGGIPLEQVVAEMGFTMDQIRNASKDPAS